MLNRYFLALSSHITCFHLIMQLCHYSLESPSHAQISFIIILCPNNVILFHISNLTHFHLFFFKFKLSYFFFMIFLILFIYSFLHISCDLTSTYPAFSITLKSLSMCLHMHDFTFTYDLLFLYYFIPLNVIPLMCIQALLLKIHLSIFISLLVKHE